MVKQLVSLRLRLSDKKRLRDKAKASGKTLSGFLDERIRNVEFSEEDFLKQSTSVVLSQDTIAFVEQVADTYGVYFKEVLNVAIRKILEEVER